MNAIIPAILALNLGYGQPIDNTQAMCLAEAVFFESSGEPIECKIKVAQTVMNRVDSNTTVCDAVYKPYQFSYTLLGSQELYKRSYVDDKLTRRAIFESSVAALQVLSEGVDSHNAKHYYNPSIVTPKWAKSFDNSFDCGNHRFVF